MSSRRVPDGDARARLATQGARTPVMPGAQDEPADPRTGPRQDLVALYRAAVLALDGRRRVADALRRKRPPGPVYAAAVGKAAGSMLMGAHDILGPELLGGLAVVPPGRCRELPVGWPGLRCVEGDHPVPGPGSLAAGEALVAFLAGLPAGASLLFLTSGGASSLVEHPAPGVTLEELRRANRWLLESGLPIQAINRVRKALSAVKGGRLARHLGARPVLSLVISDVPGDDLSSIGSGLLVAHARDHLRPQGLLLPEWLADLVRHSPPGAPEEAFREVQHAVVASSADARAVVAHRARRLGYPVVRHDQLVVGEAQPVGQHLAERVRDGPRVLQVWGGETTVRLPPGPGRGGRCQTLALSAATVLAGVPDVLLLAAGTDGQDGTGGDAGALVDGDTVARGALAGLSAADALARADAGSFLLASGDLLRIGPTGTNVMDLMIGLRVAERGTRGRGRSQH